MLELRNFPERLKRKGAGTVSEMEDVLERIPDELARNVMRQGILLGQALLLRDQAARRFDKRTAAWLCYLVDLSGRDSIDRVAAALFEYGTEAEFLERVQTENGKPPQTGGAQDVEAQRSTGGRQLSKLLDGQPRPVDINKVTDALIECATGDEFVKRVRMGEGRSRYPPRTRARKSSGTSQSTIAAATRLIRSPSGVRPSNRASSSAVSRPNL